MRLCVWYYYYYFYFLTHFGHLISHKDNNASCYVQIRRHENKSIHKYMHNARRVRRVEKYSKWKVQKKKNIKFIIYLVFFDFDSTL